MTNAELGKYLARKLFDVGSFDTDACQRIQFKGGRKTPADPETSLGGFGEKPLAAWFAKTLDEANANNG